MVAQDRRVTNGDEKPGSDAPFSHRLASRTASHRLACENIYRPDLASDRLQRMHRFHKMMFPRRRSVPRLVDAIANKSGGRERFPVAKERLFRASESVGEQRHRMLS